MSEHQPQRILVTGGAGFIGSCFVRQTLAERELQRLVVLDSLSYAGNLDNLDPVAGDARLRFVRGDIRDREAVARLLEEERIDSLLNFAAESHVDRSISGPQVFFETNVLGTQALLEAARQAGLPMRYLQVGTDEVYGALALDSPRRFAETDPLEPNSPYAASKAAADLAVRAWQRTHAMDVVLTRASNNYGPYQFPEKLIPLMIHNALADKPLPVYGDGLYVRDWLWVEDHCHGIWTALCQGRSGKIYNIGGDSEQANIDVVRTILERLGKPDSLIRHVQDRPGHDRRYALDASKLQQATGWRPRMDFERGIAQTIEWYRENPEWLERVASGAYRQRHQL